MVQQTQGNKYKYHVNKMRQKSYDHFNRNHLAKSASSHDRNSQQISYRRNVPQHKKGHIGQAQN